MFKAFFFFFKQLSQGPKCKNFTKIKLNTIQTKISVLTGLSSSYKLFQAFLCSSLCGPTLSSVLVKWFSQKPLSSTPDHIPDHK